MGCSFLVKEKINHIVPAVMSNRYHTNKPSFNWINLPKGPGKTCQENSNMQLDKRFFHYIRKLRKKQVGTSIYTEGTKLSELII